MEWEAELGACTPRQERRGERDVPSPDLGPWRSAHEDGATSLRALIDASPGLRGEKFFLEYARGLRIFVLRRKEFKVHEEEHKGRKTTGKMKTTQRKKPAATLQNSNS
jgi:hypothetical protein